MERILSSCYKVGSCSILSEPGLGFISLCVLVKMLGFRVFGFCEDVSVACLEDGSKLRTLGLSHKDSQGLSLHKYNWIILDFQASSQRGNY